MKKILVIEDNLEVRENLCEILELDSYEVVSAENGKMGVEMAIEQQPDLILCDVMMPLLDGFGVLKILNKNPQVNHIPLIFLTAKAEKDDMRKGMGLGAEDYITKPFDDVELLEAIDIRLKKAERIQKVFEQSAEAPIKHFYSEVTAKQELENLSLDAEVRKFKPKDLLYEEGQHPRSLFLLLSGRVKIFQTNEYGKELIIQVLDAGDYFGYSPLIKDTSYTNSATCISDSEIRLIPKEDFFLLLYSNRDFSAQFIKLLASKAEETEKQLIDLAYSSVRRKVANAILSFINNKDIGEGAVKIHATRDDLASKAGTAKETLIRTLSDFKKEGLVELESKSILIRDPNALENLIA